MSMLEAIDSGSYTEVQSEPAISIQGLGLWHIAALRTVLTVGMLPHNWDSYGSQPPTPLAVRASLGLLGTIDIEDLPFPNVVPVPGGGIQFEWIASARELELEVLPNGSVEFLMSANGEPLHEGEAPFEAPFFHALLGWLLSGNPPEILLS